MATTQPLRTAVITGQASSCRHRRRRLQVLAAGASKSSLLLQLRPPRLPARAHRHGAAAGHRPRLRTRLCAGGLPGAGCGQAAAGGRGGRWVRWGELGPCSTAACCPGVLMLTAGQPARRSFSRAGAHAPCAADEVLGAAYAHVVLDISAAAEVSFIPKAVHQHFGPDAHIGCLINNVRAGGAGRQAAQGVLGPAGLQPRTAARAASRRAAAGCARPATLRMLVSTATLLQAAVADPSMPSKPEDAVERWRTVIDVNLTGARAGSCQPSVTWG